MIQLLACTKYAAFCSREAPSGSLPNLSSTGHKVFGGDWRGLEPPRHLVLFTATTLISTLFRAGFDQIRQVSAPFVSLWYFTSSHRIALAEDPVPTNGFRLSRWLKLKAT